MLAEFYLLTVTQLTEDHEQDDGKHRTHRSLTSAGAWIQKNMNEHIHTCVYEDRSKNSSKLTGHGPDISTGHKRAPENRLILWPPGRLDMALLSILLAAARMNASCSSANVTSLVLVDFSKPP